MCGRFRPRRWEGVVKGMVWIGGEGDLEGLLVHGRARLGSGSCAVRAAVVGWRNAASVVVAELDDHEVALLKEGLDGCEPAFAGEAAGGPAGEGFVDDWDGEGVVQVLTPAWVNRLVGGFCKMGSMARCIPSVPFLPPSGAIVESPAMYRVGIATAAAEAQAARAAVERREEKSIFPEMLGEEI